MEGGFDEHRRSPWYVTEKQWKPYDGTLKNYFGSNSLFLRIETSELWDGKHSEAFAFSGGFVL